MMDRELLRSLSFFCLPVIVVWSVVWMYNLTLRTGADSTIEGKSGTGEPLRRRTIAGITIAVAMPLLMLSCCSGIFSVPLWILAYFCTRPRPFQPARLIDFRDLIAGTTVSLGLALAVGTVIYRGEILAVWDERWIRSRVVSWYAGAIAIAIAGPIIACILSLRERKQAEKSAGGFVKVIDPSPDDWPIDP